MTLKASGDPPDPEFDRFENGLGWIAHPEEEMRRASQAVDFGDGVWIVDPLEAPELEADIEALGDVKGVVVLLDRHERDAAAVANRFDVPVYRPPSLGRSFDAPVEDLGNTLPGTGVEVRPVLNWPGWSEWALYDGETLVLADALGTASYFTVGAEPVGVHPFVRIAPPRGLAELSPERILVGHGTGLHENATGALHRAVSTARRNLPRAWGGALRSLL
jgi:hypothetical protein